MSKDEEEYFHIDASLIMKHTSLSLLTVKPCYSQLYIAASGSGEDNIFLINISIVIW